MALTVTTFGAMNEAALASDRTACKFAALKLRFGG